MESESRYFVSGRLRLHYLVWGDTSKPPLILIHGTRDHARSWEPTALGLVDRFCVYAPDLRGHGDSEWALGGTYSFIDYALDLHALGEEIGRPPYSIVGHSLGGGVALQYAGAFPESVSQIVSIEGMGGMHWSMFRRRPAHVRMRGWVESMRALEKRASRVYPDVQSAAARMIEANEHLSADQARYLTETGVRQVEGGIAWKFDNFTRSGSPYEFNMEDARDLWNQIRCPILVISGKDSWGAQGSKVDFSPFHDFRHVEVEDAGHWVQHDQFEVFMKLVDEFLEDLS
ncbi:MAG TPA: alpha/beta hydrolase [Dehalococcoidia bacterium]|nr:alpha/beta hydrolase [Dehalococcoidia bacterium]